MHIVYVSDGKAGHRSQALGLFKAMQRQSQEAVTFQEISIDDLPIVTLISALFSHQLHAVEHEPTYIFGVGSHTHFRVWLFGQVYRQAKTVILMKPSLPFALFDYAVIPEHDGVTASKKVLVTQGALNPIVNEQRHQQGRILIALGGSSKRHQWNDAKVLNSIQHITADNPEAEIILTTSRRTPKAFLNVLEQQNFSAQLQIYPVEQTPQGWIFKEMQKAEAVWVTGDSVSMIYEALTAGCKVGVIEVDRLKEDRITGSVDLILQKGLVSLSTSSSELTEPSAFKEADRVATYLLTK
ncbi:ELM1/GtrOC1 family putative glycosyltransferase [Acinetobacter sp. YH12049]|uniref:ELM1/GtrOC1 family putative glycosyltransferase n=1 Tax=Acinetobacter sp. YH12049 TaxID=2601054 RepID=UPI0015D351BD|nr:ELM1/GtrOC1 family putative glycosyltransferase [Acinetobacter sp. YH12049]